MSFIKKIFNKEKSDYAHRQFSRFSKGVFENKALVDITVSKDKIKLKTSAEFVNELVVLMANTINGAVHVKGIVFSTKNLSEESNVEFDEVKSAMGAKKHILDKELTKEQILGLCNKFPEASIQLSFTTDYGTLKIKEKTPKSGKPGKGDAEPKADFCVLTTEDKGILEEYAFDVKCPFKKLFVKHTFEIKYIEIPEEYKNDFAMARKMGIRKGMIIRYLTVDGEQEQKDVEIEV